MKIRNSINVFATKTLTLVLCALLSLTAYSKDLNVSLAFLPKVLESPDKGTFIDLVKAIDDKYDGNINIGVYPFPRSIDYVVTGKTDFHIPMIRNKLIDESALPYRYASETMGYVEFVIYSNKSHPITAETINAAKASGHFNLKIETSSGFDSYYDFPILSYTHLKSSLMKVNNGRIDAVIYPQEEGDYICRTKKLGNIYRSPYDKFDDVIIIPKGERGDDIDAILSPILVELKQSGRWAALHKKVHLPYQSWQPYEMGW